MEIFYNEKNITVRDAIPTFLSELFDRESSFTKSDLDLYTELYKILEKNITKSINDLPNSIEESANKIREERHGVGAKYDTGGLYLAPVKVFSAKFVTKEYSNYKDISLRYKNVSKKNVTAIRFKWYGENAFNEPADMGGIIQGWGNGFTDDLLKPGANDYGEWSILSKDGKKVLIAYPYEVAFADGTKWILSQ